MTNQTQAVATNAGKTSAEAQSAPTDFQRLLEKPHERAMEFVPYGATDRIKLSVAVVQKLVAVRTKSGATCSDRDAMRFMMMCQAQRLNPFAGDAFLIGYDGKDGPQFSLITAHQAFLKRAELHPEYDGMKSGVIVMQEDGSVVDLEGDFFLPDQKVIGGWATVFFKNRKVPCTRRIRLSRFQKSFGVWQDDAGGMICKCAEADALRSSFPTLLGGLFLRDEIDLKMETNVAVELPANGLVEVRGAPHRTDNESAKADDDGDVAPLRQVGTAPPLTDAEETKTPQVDLMEVVTTAGYDFNTFQRWGEASGSVPDASSLPGFRAVPKAVCESLLKAFRGARSRPLILEQLEKAKGELV
jgi:phage recombination protein Bet